MLTAEDYEKLDLRCELVHDSVQVLYATPSAMTKWRVDTLFEKDPVTLRRIAGFGAGEVLVNRVQIDVGPDAPRPAVRLTF